MAIDRTPQQQRKADIDTIRKLLAKAEAAATEPERDAFNEHAERLSIRLGIDRALIDAQNTDETKREKVIAEERAFRGGDALMEVRFFGRIAQALKLQVVEWTVGDNWKKVEVLGHESDVARFFTIYTSLRLQAGTWLKRRTAESDEVFFMRQDGNRGGITRWKRGYMLGFATGAAERITRSGEQVVAEATAGIPGTALVVADRHEVVKAALAAKYPKLGKGRAIQSDRRASRVGYVDGQKANMGGHEIAGSRAALGGR
jgi:hypothetical protein